MTNKQKKGFTIIEVVLVLAIAGLIFLMVFIALPALQRGQRDTQRRDDVARVSTQINNYQTNNRGNIPDDNAKLMQFKNNYMPEDEFQDPKEGPYTLSFQNGSDSAPISDYGVIRYVKGATCGDDGVAVSGGARNFALRIKLEGQSVPHCIDNR